MELVLGTAKIELLPGRATFLCDSAALIVSDLHLGKSATFRKRGLAVPEGSTASDLSRLTGLLKKTKASQLVIAGDLVHSADGLTTSVIASLKDWLEEISIPVTLTEGNHDSRSWLSRHKLNFKTTPSLEISDLLITHDPADLQPDQPGIAGHLHPGIRVKESARQSLRIGGFYLRQSNHLVLPAFSEFTGTHPVSMSPGDRFFVELNDKISEIPATLFRR